MSKTFNSPNPTFSPSLNGPCLCGSGKKFKRCCGPHYKGRKPGQSAIKAFDSGDFKTALRECRADVTQYTIWYKSHTEPAYRAGFDSDFPLMDTDIRAMGELVDQLFFCYQKLDRVEEFPQVLQQLRTNINEERWHRKITYFHTLCALWPNWNREAGKRELRRIGGLEQESDPAILQLYIDLFGSDLTFSRMMALADRAVEISEKRVDTLHYHGLRATQYLFVGDETKAKKELEHSIAEFRIGGTDDLSAYESFRFAMALEVLGGISENATLLDEALAVLDGALIADNLTTAGRANTLRSIGDIRRGQAKWLEALDAYEKAAELDNEDIFGVFAAECLLRLDRADEAAERLRGIDQSKLAIAERGDYVFTFAAVAIESGGTEYCEQAEQELSELNFKEPYFRQRRDALLLELVKSGRDQNTTGGGSQAKSILSELLAWSRRYLILQPNIMGFGINLEKIAEDISDGTDKHREKQIEDRDKEV